MNITVKDSQEVQPEFKWRQSGDKGFITPSAMATTHLFYTLRMIWNHTMPEEFKIIPYKHHSFGPYYTVDYMKAAIVAMSGELALREDLPGDLRAQLKQMINSFYGRVEHDK